MIKLLLFNIIIVTLVVISSSCSIDNGLRELRIVYAPEHMNINVPASCSSFEHELMHINRKRITDIDFFQKVSTELKLLKKDNDHDLSTKSVDVRMRCFLDYREKTDTLCLGDFKGILFNGELMQDNATLLKLLKSKIYP